MNTEDLQTELPRLLVERISHLLVVESEAAAGATRVGVAVPLPGVDAVSFNLAFHLLEESGPVRCIGDLVPVMIGSAVALAQGPLAAGQVVDLLLTGGHQPAGEDLA